MSRMDHWSVVAMVSVPAMTRSRMDAIKLSSWKRLSFLFFSLKNTRGEKSHKTIRVFSKLRKYCITYSTAGCVFVNWVIKQT